MVKRGDVIENPITGEKIEFLQTSEDTDGSLLQLSLTVKPDGIIAAPHIHPIQEERFLVKTGKLRLRVDDVESVLVGGQKSIIPRGTPHVWWNGGTDDSVALVEFRPALQTEDYFSTLFALARAGKTNRMGVPNLLQVAVMNRKYYYEVYPARLPVGFQKILYRSIAWIGKLLGYQADYPYRALTPEVMSMPLDSELAPVPIENNHRH
jgi:quercetin dioxygenase-like cupin family protein